MKRFFVIAAVFLLMFCFHGCSTTYVTTSADVTLTFLHCDADIQVTLEKEEAAAVLRILNGNIYESIFLGSPACGFDRNISLRVGNRIFAIACDTCNCIQDYSNLRYFNIPRSDMDYIHGLFEKYGGHFPCV